MTFCFCFRVGEKGPDAKNDKQMTNSEVSNVARTWLGFLKVGPIPGGRRPPGPDNIRHWGMGINLREDKEVVIVIRIRVFPVVLYPN